MPGGVGRAVAGLGIAGGEVLPTARAKTSGVEVDTRLHLQFKVRDDMIVYLFEHEDRAAALAAVGPRE